MTVIPILNLKKIAQDEFANRYTEARNGLFPLLVIADAANCGSHVRQAITLLDSCRDEFQQNLVES